MSTSTVDLDPKRYGRLLAKALPGVIKSESEHSRTLEIIEGLMAKGEDLSAEEEALLDLLVDLVHDFESKNDRFPASPPHKMLAFLLEQRGLRPSDLWPVLGTKSRSLMRYRASEKLAKSKPRNLRRFSTLAFNCSSNARKFA